MAVRLVFTDCSVSFKNSLEQIKFSSTHYKTSSRLHTMSHGQAMLKHYSNNFIFLVNSLSNSKTALPTITGC